MSVYQKLANIQRELFVPKGQENSFGHYNYRSCEDILKVLKPICDTQDCVVFITNDMEHHGDFNYVKAVVTLVDLESGENIQSTAYAREEDQKKGMDGSQISGASSSYARKYALAGMFCIDNEKDSDATNTGESRPRRADVVSADAKETAELRAKVMGYCNRHSFTKEQIDKICSCYKKEKLSDLTAEECKHYISCLEKKGGNIDE